ncbi:MAG: ComEC/Rec2 family competence protein [Patescibacteria group bacterium]
MRKLSFIHLIVLLCLSVFAFSTHSTAQEKDGLLKVYFMDVGQGDAIFIETPNGNQVLIDGGPDNKVIQELSKVMPFYDRDIDMIIASHPHADHVAGLIEVLERYDVKNVLQAKEDYNSPVVPVWIEAVRNEGANEIEAISGNVIDLGNGATLTIIHPFISVAGTLLKNPHDAVVVAILKYGALEVMLTGDMEAKVERRLMLEGYDLKSDILKVGHHGSKTSTTSEFLSAVAPEVAFIQVGAKNRYGHPSPEVLSRLEKFGIKYYRNDLDGTVKVVSDGQSYQIIRSN